MTRPRSRVDIVGEVIPQGRSVVGGKTHQLPLWLMETSLPWNRCSDEIGVVLTRLRKRSGLCRASGWPLHADVPGDDLPAPSPCAAEGAAPSRPARRIRPPGGHRDQEKGAPNDPRPAAVETPHLLTVGGDDEVQVGLPSSSPR
jgi:hypothetical protein